MSIAENVYMKVKKEYRTETNYHMRNHKKVLSSKKYVLLGSQREIYKFNDGSVLMYHGVINDWTFDRGIK